jgi:hypothetical protein
MGDELINPFRLRITSMNLRRTENDIEKLYLFVLNFVKTIKPIKTIHTSLSTRRHSFQVSIPNASDPHDIFVKFPGPADRYLVDCKLDFFLKIENCFANEPFQSVLGRFVGHPH